jgi:hypothetical protein
MHQDTENGTNVRELETKIQALIMRLSSQKLEKLMEKEQARSILCKRGEPCLKVI